MWKEPGGQSDCDTVALCPPQCHCSGRQGEGAGLGSSALLLRPLDVWIHVMEQMVSLILTRLVQMPCLWCRKMLQTPEFHPAFLP